ncbi:hypothetical protein BZZ01_19540 [Nostocales cyanobacterium HT-58-2]|nr:hypothetical protein BZZ01_19540 [Nostocales cyanobacterium HT-58-2]
MRVKSAHSLTLNLNINVNVNRERGEKSQWTLILFPCAPLLLSQAYPMCINLLEKKHRKIVILFARIDKTIADNSRYTQLLKTKADSG